MHNTVYTLGDFWSDIHPLLYLSGNTRIGVARNVIESFAKFMHFTVNPENLMGLHVIPNPNEVNGIISMVLDTRLKLNCQNCWHNITKKSRISRMFRI